MSEKNDKKIIESMALLYGNPECVPTPSPIPTEQTVPGSSHYLKCLRGRVKASTHPGRKLRVGVACPHEGDCDNSPSCRQIYSQDILEMNGTCRYFKGKPTHVFAQSP